MRHIEAPFSDSYSVSYYIRAHVLVYFTQSAHLCVHKQSNTQSEQSSAPLSTCVHRVMNNVELTVHAPDKTN